jgi:hypothetical protein
MSGDDTPPSINVQIFHRRFSTPHGVPRRCQNQDRREGHHHHSGPQHTRPVGKAVPESSHEVWWSSLPQHCSFDRLLELLEILDRPAAWRTLSEMRPGRHQRLRGQLAVDVRIEYFAKRVAVHQRPL